MQNEHLCSATWMSVRSELPACFLHPTPVQESPEKLSTSTAATTSWDFDDWCGRCPHEKLLFLFEELVVDVGPVIEYISRHAVPECDSSSARGESYTTVAGGVIRIRNSSRCKGAHYSRKVELGSAPIGVRQQDPRNGICSSLAETSLAETEVSRILFQQARIDEWPQKPDDA